MTRLIKIDLLLFFSVVLVMKKNIYKGGHSFIYILYLCLFLFLIEWRNKITNINLTTIRKKDFNF